MKRRLAASNLELSLECLSRRESSCCSEVADAQTLAGAVDEQVGALQVAVQHLVVVQVRETQQRLPDVVDHHEVGEGAEGVEQVRDGAACRRCNVVHGHDMIVLYVF